MTFRKLNKLFYFHLISSFLVFIQILIPANHLHVYDINFQLTIIPKIKKQILLFTLYQFNIIQWNKFNEILSHENNISFPFPELQYFMLTITILEPFNSLPKMNGATVKSSIDRLPVNRSCCTDHLRHRFPRIIVHDGS